MFQIILMHICYICPTYCTYWQGQNKIYTGCNRRNRPNFGRVFLRSNYTDI